MKCSCGADAYSLNPAEVVVHRTDGPCTIEPALRSTIAAWDFDHSREPRKVWTDDRWQHQCRCGATFSTFDHIYWHRIDALASILTAGVNDGPGGLLPHGADDAPDESKGDAASPPASRPAPAVNLPTALHYCGGELRHWRGTDGHGGSEWFATCEKCGRTT